MCKTEEIIKIYEEKKKEFNEKFAEYEKYYKFLEENGKEVQKLEGQWTAATNSKEKENVANRIRAIHHQRREVCDLFCIFYSTFLFNL